MSCDTNMSSRSAGPVRKVETAASPAGVDASAVDKGVVIKASVAAVGFGAVSLSLGPRTSLPCNTEVLELPPEAVESGGGLDGSTQ